MAQSTDFQRSVSMDAIEPQLGRRLDDVERDLVLGTLARCGGNRTWAADILGLSLADLRQRILSYAVTGDDAVKAKTATRADRYHAILAAYDPGVCRPS